MRGSARAPRRTVSAAALAAMLLWLGLTGCRQPRYPDPAHAPQNAAQPAVQPGSAAMSMPVAPGLETRSLLSAIDQAQFGAAAQVHTSFAVGSGLVLPATHEVLAHLHVVLTPEKTIADPISVNLSLSPRSTQRNLRAYAVAQDPRHDLVLLRVDGPAPPPGNVPRQDPAALPTSTAGTRPMTTRHHRRAPENDDDSVIDLDAPPPVPRTKQKDKVKTRIIYDGPATDDGAGTDTGGGAGSPR